MTEHTPPPRPEGDSSQAYPPAPPPAPQQDGGGYPGTAPPAYVEAPEQRSVWPTAIGVISIVWGALGLICIPFSLMSGLVPDGLVEQEWRFPAWQDSWSIVQPLLLIAVELALLIGGIQLVKRRPSARGLHLAYAWSLLVLVTAGAALTVLAMSQIEGHIPDIQRNMLLVGLISGSIFPMAYPVFCIIWFGRSCIREEMDDWRDEAAIAGEQLYRQ